MTAGVSQNYSGDLRNRPLHSGPTDGLVINNGEARGGGGLQNGGLAGEGGGACDVVPLQKGGQKCFIVMLNGGNKRFCGSFYVVA